MQGSITRHQRVMATYVKPFTLSDRELSIHLKLIVVRETLDIFMTFNIAAASLFFKAVAKGTPQHTSTNFMCTGS